MLVDDRPTPVSIGCVYGHILQADETSRLSPCQQLYAFPTQLCLEGVMSANVRAPIGAQCETPPCICYVGCNAWIDTRGTWLSKIMHESRDEHCNVRFAGGILFQISSIRHGELLRVNWYDKQADSRQLFRAYTDDWLDKHYKKRKQLELQSESDSVEAQSKKKTKLDDAVNTASEIETQVEAQSSPHTVRQDLCMA